jgi:hypothetical protein
MGAGLTLKATGPRDEELVKQYNNDLYCHHHHRNGQLLSGFLSQ